MLTQEVKLWEHIASFVVGVTLFFDGTTMKLYIGGNLVNEAEVIVRCGDMFTAQHIPV